MVCFFHSFKKIMEGILRQSKKETEDEGKNLLNFTFLVILFSLTKV